MNVWSLIDECDGFCFFNLIVWVCCCCLLNFFDIYILHFLDDLWEYFNWSVQKKIAQNLWILDVHKSWYWKFRILMTIIGFWTIMPRFSWSDLRSNKIVNKNQDRDGPRCPKQVSLKSNLLLPFTKFSKVYFFQRLINISRPNHIHVFKNT
jgi:hypothetical protein